MNIDQFAQALGFTLEEIKSRTRLQEVVEARNAMIYHLRRRKMTTILLGKLFNRNHATILNSLKRVNELLSIKDVVIRSHLDKLQEIDPD